MPAFALPQSLEEQLDELAGEIRRLRILRGFSWLVAVLFAAPMAAIALDASFDLSGRARGALLGGWIALGFAAARWFVVRRFRETIPPDAIARIIEEKFPNLAERLRTLVGLSERADAGNGSPTMMALLARETERRTQKLDFHRAAPTALSFRAAGLVTIAGLLALAPLLFVSGSADRVRRLLVPWHSAPVEQPYEIVVSSGDPVVKRGQSITLSGYLKKLQPNTVLPDSAAVLFREPGSTDEKKLPMVGDDKSAFTLTRPHVATDLEYCIECGAIRSEWHTIVAVDPVGVATGSEVAITPPNYAAALRSPLTIPAQGDIEALQHSKAAILLKMSRKAEDVQLEWRPNDSKSTAPVERLEVRLDATRTTATAEMPLRTDGTLKWILFAEKDIRTEAIQPVRALPDAPPKFERVAGFPSQTRNIRPGEELGIDLVATDDVAITKVWVEYGPAESIDDSSLVGEPVTVAGLGTGRVEGKVNIRLPASAAEGQAFRVRLRIQDNRAIPELDWKPQQATFPEKGWATLRVSSSARPPAEQDVVAKADAIRHKLDAIRNLLTKSHADLKGLRLEFQRRAKLEQDQSIRLTADLEAVREALGLLEELTRETAGRPWLSAIRTLAQDLADGEVRTAEAQFKKVLTETEATGRDTAALAAQHALEAALLKLAALEKSSDTASAYSLDQTRLDQLAKDQEKLAGDAKALKATGELAAEQRKLTEELQKLMRESETLRVGEADAEAARLRELAGEIRRLAEAQKELDAAIRKGNLDADRDQLDELAKKQKALADRMKRLAEKTELATRVAQTAPLEQKPAQNAAELLEKKKPIDALTEQEKAARDLDRLAEALDKAATDRGDGRKAAQQLARWQEDLQRRVTDGLKQTPRGDSPADREKWAAEQRAIREATAELPLPPSPPLDKIHQLAKDATAGAAEQVKRDPALAAESLRKASEILNLLAEKTPGHQQRLQAAALELDKLRKEQDAIAREVDDALRNAKNADDPEVLRKLVAAAERQDELAKKIAKQDAPGSEARRTKAADASQRAKDDLQNGQPKEAVPSQVEAKRQLDWLKQSLNGQTPADEQAGELSRLQKELTENLAKLEKPTPDELQRLQRQQKEIARQLQQMQAPEAPAPLQQAREAAQAAEAALRKTEPDIDELKKKSRQAQAATRELSEKLNKGGMAQAEPKSEEPTNLPNKKDANEARELAREQRELREQLSRLAEKSTKTLQPSKGDPLKELADLQRRLAEDAGQLAREATASGQPDAAAKADEAAKKAHAAGKKLDIGDVDGARPDADAAKGKLGEAARATAIPELKIKAEQLQQRQSELARTAEDRGGDRGAVSSRERAKQQELARETRNAADKLDRTGSPEKSARDAADGLKQAATAMEQADRMVGSNKPAEAAESRRQAAEALDKSQKALAAIGPAPMSGDRAEAARAAATAGRQAREQMRQAEQELGKPNGTGAGVAPAMRRAAERLKEAAGKLGEANHPTSGPKAGAPEKPATQLNVPSAVAENLGKAWGDLPGDVKTQITQELKAKYGEDYARLIKLYFEQLAERE